MKDVCLLRKGLIGELETINTYRKLLLEAESEDVKKVFTSIIEEEMVHCGEFRAMIERLCSTTAMKEKEGFKEVDELLITEAKPMWDVK